MLYFEKVHKTVGISIRKKNGFFSFSICCSLLLSIFLHVLWTILFPISSLYIHTNKLILSPTFVDAIIPNYPNGHSKEKKNPYSSFSRYIVKPPTAIPLHSQLPKMRVEKESLSLTRPLLRSFSTEKSLVFTPESSFFFFQNFQNPLEIHVSGFLSKFTIISPSFKELLIPIKDTKQLRLLYEVQVNIKEGKICCWKNIGMKQPYDIALFGKQILKKIQFQFTTLPGQADELILGTIELVLHAEISQIEVNIDNDPC